MAKKYSKFFTTIKNKIKNLITPELVFGLISMREITKEEFKMIMGFEKSQKESVHTKG